MSSLPREYVFLHRRPKTEFITGRAHGGQPSKQEKYSPDLILEHGVSTSESSPLQFVNNQHNRHQKCRVPVYRINIQLKIQTTHGQTVFIAKMDWTKSMACDHEFWNVNYLCIIKFACHAPVLSLSKFSVNFKTISAAEAGISTTSTELSPRSCSSAMLLTLKSLLFFYLNIFEP